MHVPLEHTHGHTHYMANNHIFIQIHQQTAVFYKSWTHGSSCSREIKKRFKCWTQLMAWRKTNKQKTMSANITEVWNKSDKFSPTILWEMAQSPHCGPAAVERSSPRARNNSRPIVFFPFPHTFAALSQLCSHACGPPSKPASSPGTSIHPAGPLPPLVFTLVCSAPLHLEDECGEGGGDNKKETSLCLSSLIGS